VAGLRLCVSRNPSDFVRLKYVHRSAFTAVGDRTLTKPRYLVFPKEVIEVLEMNKFDFVSSVIAENHRLGVSIAPR
jgi:hypothetical protein